MEPIKQRSGESAEAPGQGSSLRPSVAGTSLPVHFNFSWMLVGNGAFSLSQWAQVAVLAKLASPALVGEYALALALVSPVFMFTDLQLSAVQATDARHRYEFSDFAMLRLLSCCVALLVVAALAFAVPAGRSIRPLALVLVLGLAADSLCDIFGGLQQKHERMDRLGISLLLRALLSVALFTTVFRQTHSILAAAATLPAVSAAVLLFWDLSMARRVLDRAPLLAWHGQRLRSLTRFSLPLGVIMMLISLNVSIPRYVLMHHSGSAELGIFASLSYVVMTISLVVNGLGQSFSPRLSRCYAEGDVRRFRSLMLRLCAVGALLGAGSLALAALFGRPLLALLYRPEYAAHVNVLLVLAATSGIGAVASFLGYAITAAHVFRYQVWTLLAAVCTTALASLLLVPRYHIMGAAIALLLSALVRAGSASAILRHALRNCQPVPAS
jgi:O-antigen/teichoic acid export membrane protein